MKIWWNGTQNMLAKNISGLSIHTVGDQGAYIELQLADKTMVNCSAIAKCFAAKVFTVCYTYVIIFISVVYIVDAM